MSKSEAPNHWVYVIITESASAIKIGRCDTEELIDKRLQAIQTGNPERLSLVAKLGPGDHPGERMLHARFRDYQMSGEWFRLDGPVIDWVIEKCDKPSADRLRKSIGRASIDTSREFTRFHVHLVFKAAWNIGPSELAEEVAHEIRDGCFSVEDVGLIQDACERFLQERYFLAFENRVARSRHARQLHELYEAELEEKARSTS